MGLNPVEGDIENLTVRALSAKLEKTLTAWYQGEFPKLPNSPEQAKPTREKVATKPKTDTSVILTKINPFHN